MKKALVLLAAALMTVSMAGCGGTKNGGSEQTEPATFIDTVDNGGFCANFDGSKGVGGGSGITIGEGQYLVIDSQITEGKVNVVVKSGGSDINTVPGVDDKDKLPTIEHEFDSVGITEYRMISPGDYMITVNTEEGAKGKICFNIVTDEDSTETAESESNTEAETAR